MHKVLLLISACVLLIACNTNTRNNSPYRYVLFMRIDAHNLQGVPMDTLTVNAHSIDTSGNTIYFVNY